MHACIMVFRSLESGWCFVMFVHVLWTCSVMKFCHVCTSIINVFSDDVKTSSLNTFIILVQTWQNFITEQVHIMCTKNELLLCLYKYYELVQWWSFVMFVQVFNINVFSDEVLSCLYKYYKCVQWCFISYNHYSSVFMPIL
jgi:hypothetical protein